MKDAAGHRHESLLARLTVVVDGSGPVVELVASSLRTIGVGRVRTGRYAAEPPLWEGPAGPPAAPGEDVAAVVFIRAEPLDPQIAAPWWHSGVTHVPIVLDGSRAEIGPLIVPGVSSCAGCHDLVRAGRGPTTTSRLSGEGVGVDPATAVLAAAVAALTLRLTLHGDRDLVGVSSEVHAERPEVIHRYWPRQPDCSCATTSERPPTTAVDEPDAAQWTMGA